jgi:hypothetical protein
LPSDFIQAKALRESFEDHTAAVVEGEALARHQLADHLRDEDLAGLGATADTARDLNGGAEQVFLLGYGLSRVQTDADPQSGVWALPVMRSECLLHSHGALNRSGSGRERGHDAIAGMLDL